MDIPGTLLQLEFFGFWCFFFLAHESLSSFTAFQFLIIGCPKWEASLPSNHVGLPHASLRLRALMVYRVPWEWDCGDLFFHNIFQLISLCLLSCGNTNQALQRDISTGHFHTGCTLETLRDLGCYSPLTPAYQPQK